MKTSEQIESINAALATAQGEFPEIEKKRGNKFFGSKYADLSDVLSACRPVLSKHGLALLQSISFVEGRILITTRLLHKSGQWFESDLSVRPIKDDAQAMGSSATYGRRYSAEAMLGVSGTQDDDGGEATGNVKKSEDSNVKKSEEKSEDSDEIYSGSHEQKVILNSVLHEFGLRIPAVMIDINREMIGKKMSVMKDYVRERKVEFNAARTK